MEKLNPETDGATPYIVHENIDRLREIFPDAFTESSDENGLRWKVDFEALQEILGEYKEDQSERYTFNWNGKAKARRIAQTPSTGTLRPCPEESVNWDSTENLFIEGDNLEVLKLLQKSYHKKVKMIYIDPPYNTGHDFIYPDSFRDNIKNYMELTRQTDEEGRTLSANAETSGRYHTDWLNMMYPRLKLARNLLRDDGLLVISIDNNEISNLKRCCDEIYGEENVLAIVVNINNPKGRSDDKHIASSHEYLVFIAKNVSLVHTYGFKPEEKITKRYNKVDSLGQKYREIDLRKTGDADRREDRQDMFYYFYFDDSSNGLTVSKEKLSRSNVIEITPLREDGVEGRWRWGFETAQARLGELLPKIMPNRGIWGVFEKDYLDGRPPVKPTTSWTFKDVNSERGSEQFVDLGFEKEVFPRPKPIGTLKRVIEISTLPNEENIIMDFFAGSGTLAQSSFELLNDSKRNLKWILVQLPEKLDQNKKEQKPAYQFCIKNSLHTNIAEICKERIRRAIKKVEAEQSEKEKNANENLFDTTDNSPELDLGFKVFKLDSSNIKPWDADFDNLQSALLDTVENIKLDRSEADVLYELLLKYGLDLTVPIEEHTIADRTVYVIGGGALIICLSEDITLKVVEGIASLNDEFQTDFVRVVFKDSGFADDVVKTNAMQILIQAGIEDVKSL